MKIEVIHSQANDKETIAKLITLLQQSEQVLYNCQSKFPDSKQYGIIANQCSIMRGDIVKAIEENKEKQSDQSFEQKLASALTKILASQNSI